MDNALKTIRRHFYTGDIDEVTRRTLRELREFAIGAGVGPDWHEPDDIKVEVVGDHLDNAFGNHVFDAAHEYQEYVVRLRGYDGNTLDINLASLLALAARFGG